jgi:hypothetical protein
VVVVVVVLGVLVWQQRTHVKNQIDKCDLSVSFFGVDIDAPDSVVRECQRKN